MPKLAPDIAVGQIWREVDPRFDRHIRIEAIAVFTAAIRTVVLADGFWIDAARSRSSRVSSERFNGKRGGYEFVAHGDAAQ